MRRKLWHGNLQDHFTHPRKIVELYQVPAPPFNSKSRESPPTISHHTKLAGGVRTSNLKRKKRKKKKKKKNLAGLSRPRRAGPGRGRLSPWSAGSQSAASPVAYIVRMATATARATGSRVQRPASSAEQTALSAASRDGFCRRRRRRRSQEGLRIAMLK